MFLLSSLKLRMLLGPAISGTPDKDMYRQFKEWFGPAGAFGFARLSNESEKFKVDPVFFVDHVRKHLRRIDDEYVALFDKYVGDNDGKVKDDKARAQAALDFANAMMSLVFGKLSFLKPSAETQYKFEFVYFPQKHIVSSAELDALEVSTFADSEERAETSFR
jgi:hypothetical protein